MEDEQRHGRRGDGQGGHPDNIWLRVMAFVERVGVPAALLGLVIWNMVGTQAKDANAAATNAAAMRTELASHHAHTETLHRNIEDYMRVQNLLTRQLCSNAAKNDDQRAGCFKP